MQGKQISIIIPMYNAELQIKKCVDSLLRQTYTDFEIIIVNDGSADNSLALCRDTYNNEPRVKIIDKPNGGVSDARNAGLKAACGSYITFIDADDWVEPTYLSCLYEHLIQTGADISAVDHRIETTDPKKLFKTDVPKEEVVSGSEILARFFAGQIATFACTKLFRRELIEDLQFSLDIKIGEDALFVYHALRRAKSVSLSPEKLYIYWVDNVNGATNNFFDRLDYTADHFSTLILNDVASTLPDMLTPASNYLMLPAVKAYLGYILHKKESMQRFKELSETLRTIFRYADHTSKYYKYRLFYLLHKACKPLGRALVARWINQ